VIDAPHFVVCVMPLPRAAFVSVDNGRAHARHPMLELEATGKSDLWYEGHGLVSSRPHLRLGTVFRTHGVERLEEEERSHAGTD
jgi:hypothetical protein